LRVELTGSGVSVVTICRARRHADDGQESIPDALPHGCRCGGKEDRGAIARRKRLYVLPWQMAVAGWFMRRLPRPLYDSLFSHAPHKPRRSVT